MSSSDPSRMDAARTVLGTKCLACEVLSLKESVDQLALQDIRLPGALRGQGRERVHSHDLPDKAPFTWNLRVETAPTSDK